MNYPDTLPCIQYADYSISRQFDTTRTQMESGWYKHRRNSEFYIDTLTLAWTMDTATFKTWFNWMDGNGYDWFKINVVNSENPNVGEITIRLDSAINYTLLGYDVIRATASAERLVGLDVPTDTYTETAEVPWL